LKFFEFISKLDRRWVFLLVGLVVTIPFFVPLGLPIEITPPVKQVYERVETSGAKEHPKPILVSVDFDPASVPELYPMLIAFLRHCFSKKIPVILMTLHPAGPGLAEQAGKTVAEEYKYIYGKDYAFLGFGVGNYIPMLKIGKDLRDVFPKDFYGTDVNHLPVLSNVKNYDDFDFVQTFCGTSVYETWITFAKSQFNATISAGLTGTMATDAYPFLQSGQLFGLIVVSKEQQNMNL